MKVKFLVRLPPENVAKSVDDDSCLSAYTALKINLCRDNKTIISPNLFSIYEHQDQIKRN